MIRWRYRDAVRTKRSFALVFTVVLTCTTIHMTASCWNVYHRQRQPSHSRLLRYSSSEDVVGKDAPLGIESLPPSYGRTQVIFDVMETVVRDPFPDIAPAFFNMSLSELKQVTNESAWISFERGEIDEIQFGATYFTDGRDFDVYGLKMTLAEGYDFIEGMPELLQDLLEAGHTIRGFTNYPEWYTLVEQRLGLEATYGLEWTCVSCDTGLRKPELASYLHLLQRLGVVRKVGAAPVLLIDASEESCRNAERAGIAVAKFEDAESLRRTLGDMLGSRKQGTAPLDGWPARILRWAGPSPPDGWLISESDFVQCA